MVHLNQYNCLLFQPLSQFLCHLIQQMPMNYKVLCSSINFKTRRKHHHLRLKLSYLEDSIYLFLPLPCCIRPLKISNPHLTPNHHLIQAVIPDMAITNPTHRHHVDLIQITIQMIVMIIEIDTLNGVDMIDSKRSSKSLCN